MRLEYLGLGIALLASFGAHVLMGQRPDCIVRLEPPIYPPFSWGSEDQHEIEIVAQLQPGGKHVFGNLDAKDKLASEAHRVISLSTFADKCYGRTLRFRFQFELRGEPSIERTSSTSFDKDGGIIVTAAPPAPLCERKVRTEAEADECYGQGTQLSLANQYGEAIRCFDAKISFAPESDAFIERGIARRKLGQFKLAIEDYDQAISLKPDNAIAYFDRGNVYQDMGHQQDAIRDYSEALRIDPLRTAAYGNRGLQYMALRSFQLALLDFNKLIEMRPRDRKAYLNRGATYLELGQPGQAIADFDRAISLSRREADAFNNRAAAYDALGRHDRALEDYNAAIQLNPDYFEARVGRGMTYALLEKYREAETDFTAALRLRPDSAEVYQARGMCRLRQGDRDNATADLEKAESLRRGSIQ